MILFLGRSSSSSAILWSILISNIWWSWRKEEHIWFPWKRHRRWRDKSSWRLECWREVNIGSNHCKFGRRQWCWKVLATAHEEGSKKEHCRDEKEVAEALASYEGGSLKDRAIAEEATRGDWPSTLVDDHTTKLDTDTVAMRRGRRIIRWGRLWRPATFPASTQHTKGAGGPTALERLVQDSRAF